MKRRTTVLACIAVFAIVFLGIGLSNAETGYRKYTNTQFHYSVIVPSSWSLYDLDLNQKHIMLSEKNHTTEIKVRAYRSDETDFDKLVSKNSWQLRKIDPLLNKIIETEKISIRQKTSKLLVFEYRSKRTRILQRTMITKSNNTIYIIECKSPIRSFYKLEKTFNIALSSFSIQDNGTTEQRKAESVQPEQENHRTQEKSADKINSNTSNNIPEEKFFELD